jgi:hypothetical protein
MEYPPGNFRPGFELSGEFYVTTAASVTIDCQFSARRTSGRSTPPLTFAGIRGSVLRAVGRPWALASAFRANALVSVLLSALAFMVFLFGVVYWRGKPALTEAAAGGDFYQVASHNTLIVVFGAVGLFSAAALLTGLLRFCRDMGESVRGPC